MLETFNGLYHQAVNKFFSKKKLRRSKAPIGFYSITAENRLQTAVIRNYFDEKVKHCKPELDDSLGLDRAVYFESMKDIDLKMF